MNLGEMTAEWREDNRDTGTPPLFSDELPARLFSEAEEEGSIRKCLIRETVTIPIVAGDMELELADGIFEVRTARIVEGDTSYWLSPSDRYEQDRLFIGWRTETARPNAFIHDDKSLTLNRLVATDADLVLEVFRTPTAAMVDADDEPEISSVHHRKLYGWVTFKAYSIPDNERQDAPRAAGGLAEFERYFGKRPDANHRRNNNANRPHRVKAW